MKKLFAIFICLFSIGFCFAAESEKFTTPDGTKTGVIKYELYLGESLVSFTKTEPSTEYKAVESSILLIVKDTADGKLFYREMLKGCKTYVDFLKVYNYISAMPEVRKEESVQNVERGILFITKMVDSSIKY